MALSGAAAPDVCRDGVADHEIVEFRTWQGRRPATDAITRPRPEASGPVVEPVTGSALDIPAEPATGQQCLLGALRAPRTAMRIGRSGNKILVRSRIAVRVATVRHMASHCPPARFRRVASAELWPVACGALRVSCPVDFRKMTFRVQRARLDDTVVLRLSGHRGDHAADLQALVDAERDRRVVLEFKEAGSSIVPVCCCWRGAKPPVQRLTNCPAYVREWIERQRKMFDERSPERRREEEH